MDPEPTVRGADPTRLKSAPLPPGVDRSKAAALGLVEAEFTRASAGVPRVTYADFRSAGRTEEFSGRYHSPSESGLSSGGGLRSDF